MSVTTAYSPPSYSGDGITSAFQTVFTYQNATDIIVQTLNVSTQAVSTLVLGTDYSVSPTTNSPANTGTVTLTGGALAVGIKLTITRAVPITQLTTWVPNDPNPSTAVQNAVDKLTLIEQQSAYSFGRALTLRPFDVNGSGAYDAMHNRITNLGDPIVALDAVNVETMQTYIAGIISTGSGFAPQHYDFTGDGFTTAFPLTGSNLTFASGYRVFYDGVYQRPNIDFTVNGSLIPPVLTFTVAPVFTKVSNISVDVIGFAVPISGGLAGLDASVITSGIFNPLRLGSGAPSADTFLNGLSQWTNTLVGPSGTASPPADIVSLFTVQQAANAGIRVFAGAGAQASLRFGTATSGNPWDTQWVYDPTIGAIGWQPFGQPFMGEFYNTGDVQFGNAGLYFARLTNRVGINNAAPQYTLDVSGTVNAINYLGAADASLIQTGTINPLRLGSGAAPGTFLRSDSVWAIPPSSGGGGGAATTTTGTFTVAAIGSTQVVPVTSATGFANNQFVYVTDGTHTIYGQITPSGISGLNITVTTTAITGGASGNTMASGAAFAASISAGGNSFTTLQLPYTTSASSGQIFFGTTQMMRQVQNVSFPTQQDTYLGGAGHLTAPPNTSNVAIGFGTIALYTGASGGQNVAIGQRTLPNATYVNATTIVGDQSMHASTFSDSNTGVGSFVLANMTTGGLNTALGAFAGQLFGATSSRNIAIGYGAENDAATTDGAMSIGNIIYGINNTGQTTTISTGNIGIGIKLPAHKLDVAGDIHATGPMAALSYAENAIYHGVSTTTATCDFTAAGSHGVTLTPSTPCTITLIPPVTGNTTCSLFLAGAAGSPVTFSPVPIGILPPPDPTYLTIYIFRWNGSFFILQSANIGGSGGSLPTGGTTATFLRGDSTWSPYLLGPIGSIDPAHSTMSSQLVSLNDGTNQYAALTQTNAGSPIHTRYTDIDGQLIVGTNLTPASAGVVIDGSIYESIFTDKFIRTLGGIRTASGYWRKQANWTAPASTLPISAAQATYHSVSAFANNTTIQIGDGTLVPISGAGYSTEVYVEIISPGAFTVAFSDGGGGSITYLSGTYTAPLTSGSTLYRFIKRQNTSGWLCEQLNSSGGTYTNAQAQDAVGGIFAASANIQPTYTSHTSMSWLIKAGTVTNTELAAGILASKLSGYPSNSTTFLRGDGTWAVPAGGGGGSAIQFQQAGSNVGAAGAFTTYNFLSGLLVANGGATTNISPDRTVLQSYINWQIGGVTQNTPSVPITAVNFASGVTGSISGNTLNVSATGSGGFNPATAYAWSATQNFNTRQVFNSAYSGLGGSNSGVQINTQSTYNSAHSAAALDITVMDTLNGNPSGVGIPTAQLFKISTGSGSAVGMQNLLSLRGQTTSGFSISMTSYTEASQMQGGTADAIYFLANSPNSQFASTPDNNGTIHTFSTGLVRAGEINYGNAWGDFGYQDTTGGSRVVSGFWMVPDWLPLEMGGSAVRYPATFGMVFAGLNCGHWTGVLFDTDSITPGGVTLNLHGGSTSGNATAAAINIQNYHTAGINFAGPSGSGGVAPGGSAATFTATGAPAIILADQTQSIKLGSVWLRGNAGALQISTNGTSWTTITIP